MLCAYVYFVMYLISRHSLHQDQSTYPIVSLSFENRCMLPKVVMNFVPMISVHVRISNSLLMNIYGSKLSNSEFHFNLCHCWRFTLYIYIYIYTYNILYIPYVQYILGVQLCFRRFLPKFETLFLTYLWFKVLSVASHNFVTYFRIVG